MSKTVDFGAAVKNGKERAPARINPFDLAPIRKRFVQYDDAIAKMGDAAQGHEVTDDLSLRAGIEMAGQCHDLVKKIESQRKAIVENPNKFIRAVNSFCKQYQEGFQKISGGLKQKISDYQYRLEMVRKEAERKAQADAKALQDRLDKEAKEKNIEAPVVVAPVLPDAPTTTRTEDASAHLRKTWTFEVEDAIKVPREYCAPCEKTIRQAVNGGVREIPGVKIFEKVQTVIRT